jgi:hypothetical protein
MYNHHQPVPVFEVVQLNQLKLQEITVFGLNCQRLVINVDFTALTLHCAS